VTLAPASTLLASLDARQREAVESRARTLLVIAGPGMGKSRVITARIVHLLEERQVPSHQVACFVFSRSAAAEVRARVVAAVGEDLAAMLTVSTFHGFALRVLRAASPEHLAGVRWPASPWRVADEVEADEVLRGLFHGPEARPEARRTGIQAVRAASSIHASTGRWGQGRQWDVLRLWWARLADRRLVPHDRLVPAALHAIENDDRARRLVQDLRFVLIDEAQDLTPSEWNLATAPERCDSDLCVTAVGDPRQAIFGWRGATFFPDWLDSLRNGPLPRGTELVLLERSYRCREAIAAFANDLSRVLRVGAPITPVPGASSLVQGLPGARLRETVLGSAARFGPANVAVLARTNLECARIASELGPDIAVLIRREEDDALRVGTAALRLVADPSDNAAARLLLGALGWPEERVRTAETAAGAARGLWEEAGRLVLAETPPGLPWDASTCWHPLTPAPSYAVLALREALGDGWEDRPAADLLAELSERQEADQFAAAARAGRVPVATAHAAKGREWDAVVLATSADWPGPRPKPDELRVLFVAATRARCALAVLEE